MSWVVLLLYETTERSSSLSWVAAYCLSRERDRSKFSFSIKEKSVSSET